MVRAQDDFYTFVNEKWLQENPCPDDYSRWGTFEELNQANQEQLRALLNEVKDSSDDWQCVQSLWTQGQDEEKLNSMPFSEVLSGQLTAIQTLSNKEDLVHLFTDWITCGIPVPFSVSPMPDLKNSDFMILKVDRCGGGLGLQDRDMYFDDKMKDKQEDYLKYLVTLTNHIQSQVSGDYFGDVSEVYKLEEKMAEACLPKVDRREPYKIYNPYTPKQLTELCPAVNWDELLTTIKVNLKEGQFVSVSEIEFMKRLNTLISETDLATWKHYLVIRLFSSLGKYLDDTTAAIRHDFYGRIMSGQAEQKPRWKRVYATINNLIGEIVGKRYVKKHFPTDAKVQVLDMIQRMQRVLEGRIKQLPWMEEETKQKALQKLSTFVVKIGFPDKWTDFSALSLDSTKSYCANVLSCNRWEFAHEISKSYAPVDKTEWHMTPQTVNAYYNPTQNEIVFPAGIIQPPMYDKDGSVACNFGGIGAVICHEITHGFDDKGAKFDHLGNLENWWTDEDKKRFEDCSEKLKIHFSEYIVEGMNVKGDLCLGENIADLGGLSISLEAFSLLMDEEGASEEKKKEEMKKVFYNWAVTWRNNIKPEEAKKRIIMDPHSPGHLRVNGIVKNMADFYKLFDVKSEDAMFLDTEKQSKIW